jgi:hypothetical protein
MHSPLIQCVLCRCVRHLFQIGRLERSIQATCPSPYVCILWEGKILLKSEYPTVRRTYQNLDSNHCRNANELHGRSITRRSAQCTYDRSLIRFILAIYISTSQPSKRVVDYTHCRSYREINTQVLKPKGDSVAIRMFIRLVVRHLRGQLTKNQWMAISALKSHKDLIRQSDELDLSAINADIRLLRKVTECDILEDDLQDLYWRVNTTSLEQELRVLCRPQL